MIEVPVAKQRGMGVQTPQIRDSDPSPLVSKATTNNTINDTARTESVFFSWPKMHGFQIKF